MVLPVTLLVFLNINNKLEYWFLSCFPLPWAACSSLWHTFQQSSARPTQAFQYWSILSSFAGSSCNISLGLGWYHDVVCTYEAGKGPRIFSIIARCSLLSWVWNSVNPRYSSNMMQPRYLFMLGFLTWSDIFKHLPTLHTSHGWDHPNSRITSGALLFYSFDKVLHFHMLYL